MVIPVPEVAGKSAGRTPSAGRDLPAAIGVGLTMLVVVLGGILIYPLAFVVIVTAFAGFGIWEFSRALLQRGIAVPMVPALIGTAAMPASAYFSGAEGLLFALVASTAAVLVWRCLDPAAGAVQSIFAGVFALMWIPFFISFVFLLLRGEGVATTGVTWDLLEPGRGAVQVALMLMLVVANDTFGYLVGVLFGKHPMAPKISPKKSWEGFAGSVAGAILIAVPATIFLLNGPWWVGLVLAVTMVAAATAGDLAESMVKRELGVKDMSSILPGHGGVMDRLDSILFGAPVAFIIFTVLGRFAA
ncbi:phosphatidate cytidylyltransferase [Paenarthrobacter sp. PH39-S1]|uniref:phosphatidate cytidylyltransferase n=1 Tax=Paenarthrobacter sp. PH39-S1 TaxID=3046204 RepID=UPI0024BB11FB|nr:phosphatidate cytidylyltransferase [Paenarthrobacter sp. PH39-S1]MDJ0358003.1 phosphatidate cytidylyltransferase [Paenarthrobacter sp. PH39-S1]